MKAVAIIHDSIWAETLELLPYETTTEVTVKRRDPEWETGADEEGNSFRRFIKNGEPYEVTVNKSGGGYIEVGMIGDWHVVMLASKPINLQAINQLSENKVLALATLTTDEDGNVSGWNSILNEGDRQIISTWMEDNEYGTIPEGATAKQATRLVWQVINSELDENSVDIAE